jgi:F420H(2)-dependent quinone reductase
MKGLFRFILAVSVYLYRLTQGNFGGRVQGLQVLLLTTVGRKTGKTHTTPLGYFVEDDNYIITASNAGFDTNPGWFHNLRANPLVKLEIKDQHIEVEAKIALPEKRNLLWSKLISLSPAYAKYATKTSREIPLIILHPLKNV